MKSMKTFAKRPILLYGALLLLSAAVAILSLWAFSNLHTPLEYMVAGTLATTVALLAIFVLVVARRRI